MDLGRRVALDLVLTGMESSSKFERSSLEFSGMTFRVRLDNEVDLENIFQASSKKSFLTEKNPSGMKIITQMKSSQLQSMEKNAL